MNRHLIIGLTSLLTVAATNCSISDEDRCPGDEWIYIPEMKMCCPSDHVYNETTKKCSCPPGWSYGADGETCEPPSSDSESDSEEMDAGPVDGGGGGDSTDDDNCIPGLGTSCIDQVNHTDCAQYCEKFCAWNPIPPASGVCTKEGCTSSADCQEGYGCCDCTGSAFLQKAIVCLPPDWVEAAGSLGGCICN